MLNMKGIALIIFYVALAAAKPREEIEVNAVGCPYDPKIAKFLPHEYCHQFYQCVGGIRISQTCPADLLYNVELSTCDWPVNVSCNGRAIPEDRPEGGEEEEQPSGNGHSDPSLAPKICATEGSEGVLVAHEHCNEFYVCQGGRPIALLCPPNLVYNPKKEQCDWPSNVSCQNRVTVRSNKVQTNSVSSNIVTSCSQDDSEGALIAHQNCNRFNKCNGGKPVALDCPAGLMYNTELHYCDWSSNVECGERTIAEIEIVDNPNNGAWKPEHGYTDPSQARAICAMEKSDGVLVAHKNCSQFYKCDRKVPVTVDCPASLLYHPELEICDWPYNVDCAGRNH